MATATKFISPRTRGALIHHPIKFLISCVDDQYLLKLYRYEDYYMQTINLDAAELEALIQQLKSIQATEGKQEGGGQ